MAPAEMTMLRPRRSPRATTLSWAAAAATALAALGLSSLLCAPPPPSQRRLSLVVAVDAFAPHNNNAGVKFPFPRRRSLPVEQQRLPPRVVPSRGDGRAHARSSLCLLAAAKKKKLSMAQKRKKRGKKLPPRPVDRPSVLDETQPVDAWDKPQSTDEKVAQMKGREGEAKAKASALIDSQRKSVDTLTFVKERVDALPYGDVARSLVETEGGGGYFVRDGFLGDETLISEMEREGVDMFRADKLERDVTNLDSGEFAARVKGGADQYVDCPRIVECIVSLTRHMPPQLDAAAAAAAQTDDAADAADATALGWSPLDASASMGSVRVFDRKARESSLALLKDVPPPKPFGFANGGDASDPRKVTVVYFLSQAAWGADCGGGVTFGSQGGGDGGTDTTTTVDAVRDRLLIFRSDACPHRTNASVGKEGLENSVCLVAHLLRKNKDENQI